MPKKEKYRLQPLLQQKERQKRKAELALAKAIKALEEEKKRLSDIEKVKAEVVKRKEDSRQEFSDKMASGVIKVAESEHYLNFLKKMDADIEVLVREISEQEEQVEEAQRKIKRARRDYIDMSSELNVMEKHKELWEKKLRAQLNAKENKEMNELGNIVHQLVRYK